jgi:hypothetical protein
MHPYPTPNVLIPRTIDDCPQEWYETSTIVGIVFLWGLVVCLYHYYHEHNHHMQLRWKETLLNRANIYWRNDNGDCQYESGGS